MPAVHGWRIALAHARGSDRARTGEPNGSREGIRAPRTSRSRSRPPWQRMAPPFWSIDTLFRRLALQPRFTRQTPNPYTYLVTTERSTDKERSRLTLPWIILPANWEIADRTLGLGEPRFHILAESQKFSRRFTGPPTPSQGSARASRGCPAQALPLVSVGYLVSPGSLHRARAPSSVDCLNTRYAYSMNWHRVPQ